MLESVRFPARRRAQASGYVVTRLLGERVAKSTCNRITKTGFIVIVDTCRLVENIDKYFYITFV